MNGEWHLLSSTSSSDIKTFRHMHNAALSYILHYKIALVCVYGGETKNIIIISYIPHTQATPIHIDQLFCFPFQTHPPFPHHLISKLSILVNPQILRCLRKPPHCHYTQATFLYHSHSSYTLPNHALQSAQLTSPTTLVWLLH